MCHRTVGTALNAIVATRRRSWRERLVADASLVTGWSLTDGPLVPQVARWARSNGAPSRRCLRGIERAAVQLDAGDSRAAAKTLRTNYWFRRARGGEVRERLVVAAARLGEPTPFAWALRRGLRVERGVKRRASRLAAALGLRR